jgi:murein L,D-transpeptidase YcbB/YkuD
MTGLWLAAARDLSRGLVSPESLDSLWTRAAPDVDPVALLERALSEGRPAEALELLEPPYEGYRALRDALARYRALPAHDDSVATRMAQLELNLERWRWLSRARAARYVIVNAVAFELVLMEEGRPLMTARVVVGRDDWPTPIVSGVLTHAVLNPAWHVPRSIAVEEILPLIRRDPGYLKRVGMRVLRDSGGVALAVDAAAVDWTAVSDTAFPYRLVQQAGPANPLGRVKLVFANPFNVALHDTPAVQLFVVEPRAFSHGCVRVDRALDLAERLLVGDSAWTRERLERALDRGRERWVPLPAPVPVHIGYWTAWVDERGVAHFGPDVYEWDARLARALASAAFTPD